MIQSNELRVGSFYNYNDNPIKLDGSLLATYLQNDTDLYLYPIPLTEECVFELEEKYWDFVGYGTRVIYQDRLHPAIKIEKTKTQWAFYFNDELINFKDYLHEAQNLYFALTNNELNIKKQ